MNFAVSRLSVLRFFSQSSFISSGNSFICRNVNFHRSFQSFFVSQSSNELKYSDCHFDGFLSSVVRFSALSYIYSTLSRANSIVSFQFTIFRNIRNQNSVGGALYCENCNLFISSCIFDGCQATSQGGAFVIKGNILDLKYTCFFNCSATKLDQSGCNAFYSVNCNGHVYQSGAYLSSSIYGSGADCLYDFSNLIAVITFWNSTECHGRSGSSGGAFRSVSPGSYLNYSTVYNSSDYTTIESWTSSIVIYRNNLVHNSRNHVCHVWGNNNNYCIYNNCLFLDCHKSIEVSCSSFTFINCISDHSYLGITTTSGFTTFPNNRIQACFASLIDATVYKRFSNIKLLLLNGLLVSLI